MASVHGTLTHFGKDAGPASDVRVTLCRFSSVDASPLLSTLASTLSDANGQYRLTARVEAGSYSLVFARVHRIAGGLFDDIIGSRTVNISSPDTDVEVNYSVLSVE